MEKIKRMEEKITHNKKKWMLMQSCSRNKELKKKQSRKKRKKKRKGKTLGEKEDELDDTEAFISNLGKKIENNVGNICSIYT